MASFALLKKASTASYLLNKLNPSLRCVTLAPSSLHRSFTRSSELSEDDSSDDSDELEMVEHPNRSNYSLGRRGYYGPANLYSGADYVLDPYYGSNPFVVAEHPRGERVLRRGWDVVEDDDTVYFKVDMPGLGKEHVKVSVEKTTLVVEGEGDKEVDGDKEGVRWYRSLFDLHEDMFKLSEIKAEMKNGCLKVSVPKVKEDEKKNVVAVTVE